MKYALFCDTVTPIFSEASEGFAGGCGGLEDEGLYGHKCTVLEEKGDMVKISTVYRYEGMVRRESLLPISHERWSRRETEDGLRFVAAPFADLLAIPRVQGRRLATLTRGGIVTVTGSADESGWVPAETAGGEPCYVKESLLCAYRCAPVSGDEGELRAALTAAARSYLGAQYRWGGKSPLGIDCSGLCSMAYMLCGIYIFRDAAIKEGFPVRPLSPDAAKPGDLLYFPGHIAMYLGEGRFIHSTAHRGSDGVVINSLREGAPDFRGDLLSSLTTAGTVFPERQA